MSDVIAIIKLAPGEVGYYDELSKIHLTISRPKANVFDYMNTSRLLRSVKSKTLVLVAGSLNPIKKEFKEEVKEEVIAVNQEVEIQPIVTPEIPAEPIVIETVEEVEAVETIEGVKEEVVTEEVIAEEVAEPKKEKKTKNKKKKEE